MEKRKRAIAIAVFAVLAVAFMIGIILVRAPGRRETIGEVMKDAVLHEHGKVNLFGLISVNPGLISAFTVTALFLLFGLAVRFIFVPRFTQIPHGMQLALETAVGYFDNLARTNSPHRNRFLGAYVFAAGAYVFVGTVFELLGLQVVTTGGESMSMPAPLSDINGAIMMGCLSYLVILSGGIASNKLRGVGRTLKEFSLPISMSFRIFGALLSGALVTEMVYYYLQLSFGLPILVGVLFTLLHALIQAYVLTMLTALFYGEVSEPAHKAHADKQ